jgi:hypothetical protein
MAISAVLSTNPVAPLDLAALELGRGGPDAADAGNALPTELGVVAGVGVGPGTLDPFPLTTA